METKAQRGKIHAQGYVAVKWRILTSDHNYRGQELLFLFCAVNEAGKGKGSSMTMGGGQIEPHLIHRLCSICAVLTPLQGFLGIDLNASCFWMHPASGRFSMDACHVCHLES